MQPPGTEGPTELDAPLRWQLRSLAVEWEILDQREYRYTLVHPDNFAGDLCMLRSRYEDLHDAPPIADSLRFPDRETVNGLLALNRAYRQRLDEWQPGGAAGWHDRRQALIEADFLYEVWDAVGGSRCQYYYLLTRRGALKRLREMLGPEAYYAGKLPPAVPVWRLQEVD